MSNILYVPIIHSDVEIENVLSSTCSYKTQVLSGENEETSSSFLIKGMWIEIQQKLELFNLNWEKVRIYQESLPVCGEEIKIVQVLANKNSYNHKLIVELVKRGAKLEGTEDQRLLLRTYELLSHAFLSSNGKRKISMDSYRMVNEGRLTTRDRFIAMHIKQTLKEDETGLVFMGIVHKLDQLLKRDYAITYVTYRIPFENVQSVYSH